VTKLLYRARLWRVNNAVNNALARSTMPEFLIFTEPSALEKIVLNYSSRLGVVFDSLAYIGRRERARKTAELLDGQSFGL
jgi:hypothetical protein